MNEELYELLGVPTNATLAQIKAAYWAKAKILHPDAGGDVASFQDLTAAYMTLSDPDLRENYDLAGLRPDEAIGKQLYRVSVHLGSMFEEIMMQAGDTPPEQIMFIETMKQHVLALQYKFQSDEDKLKKLLTAFHKLHKLVRRKDKGQNVFLEIARKKIIEITAAYKEVQEKLGDVKRVYELLNNYESVTDVIRTMHFQQGLGAYSSNTGEPYPPPVRRIGN